MEFKIGDKVKVTDVSSYHHKRVGVVKEVRNMGDMRTYVLKFYWDSMVPFRAEHLGLAE